MIKSMVRSLAKSVINSLVVSDGGGVTPPPLDSDLYLWLDASKEETIEISSGLVFQWNDPRDNGRNVSQSSNTRKPVSGAETKNGLNILRFSGDNRLQTTLSPVIPNTAFTMFSVSGPASPSAAMALEMYKSGTTISAGLQQYPNVTQYVRSRNKSSSSLTSETPGGNLNDWNIISGGMDTSGSPTITSRINNASGSAVLGSFSADAYDQFLVGNGVIEVFNALFRHAEVLLYTKTLSLPEMDEVVQYLSDKWDIT